MQHLTERERISLLMMRGWGNRQRSYNDVRQLFNATFRNDNTSISKSTVYKTIRRFEETGSVKDRPKPGRPVTATNPAKSLDVLQSFVEHPHSSTNRTAEEHEIDQKSVYKILKQATFHPYKVHLVQELNEDDFDRRLQFCELMMERIDAEPEFLYNIVFSDEATFQIDGNINRHNCRFWSDTNPHWKLELHTQHQSKVNVWAGILNNTLIGPFIIEGNLNAVMYEDMLRNEIVPATRAIVGEDIENTWFQQDGAAPHYARNVRNYLNEVFAERWIGRRGPIEWPARSPDLSPLDYFLWGYLKSKVYVTKPQTVQDLRRRILDEAALIPRDYIRNAISGCYSRLAHCQTVNGAHFENLL